MRPSTQGNNHIWLSPIGKSTTKMGDSDSSATSRRATKFGSSSSFCTSSYRQGPSWISATQCLPWSPNPFYKRGPKAFQLLPSSSKKYPKTQLRELRNSSALSLPPPGYSLILTNPLIQSLVKLFKQKSQGDPSVPSKPAITPLKVPSTSKEMGMPSMRPSSLWPALALTRP